jgi:hypothetical protein
VVETIPQLHLRGLHGIDKDNLTFHLRGTRKVYCVKQNQKFKILLA